MKIKYVLIILSAVLVTLGGASFFLLSQYSNVMPVSTMINEIDVSLKGLTNAVYSIEEGFATNKVQISITTGEGNMLECSAADMGLTINKSDLEGSVSQILAAESFSIGKGINFDKKEKEVEIKYNIDNGALNSFIESNKEFFEPSGGKKIEPKNSYIELNATKKRFEIIPEVLGNVKKENGNETLYNALMDVVDKQKGDLYSEGPININLYDIGFYDLPEIIAEDENLNNNLKLYEDYFYRDISLDYLAGKVEPIELVSHFDWFVPQYADENKLILDANQPFAVNTDLLMEFIREISFSTDTLGMPRPFKTHGGYDMTISAGYYGWLVNEPLTLENIINVLDDFKTKES
ncbi:MAG: hypothetical protein LBV08_10040, partial [Clostridiales bacterium]|nr:hypothetical protein [Clostridiales bacterium]